MSVPIQTTPIQPAPIQTAPVQATARPGATIRSQRRSAVSDRLLDGLEALIARHRALAPGSVEHSGLHAELITAEVAQELALARSALRRAPHLAVVDQPESDR